MNQSIKNQVSFNELMTLRNSGMSNKDIADHLDISYKTVYNIIGKDVDYNFHNYLYSVIYEKGISITELSNMIGYKCSYIRKILNQEIRPTAPIRFMIKDTVSKYLNNKYSIDSSTSTNKTITVNNHSNSDTISIVDEDTSSDACDIFDYIMSKTVIYELGLGFNLKIESISSDSVIYRLSCNGNEIFSTNDKKYLIDKFNQIFEGLNKILNMN